MLGFAGLLAQAAACLIIKHVQYPSSVAQRLAA